MRWIARICLLVLVLFVVGAAAAIVMAFEQRPLVTAIGHLSPAQVSRAVALFRANDPRRLKDGQVAHVTLRQEEIALALAHGLDRLGAGGADAIIGDGSMQLRGTLDLPRNPLGRYLNLDATLIEGEPLPRFASLRIGRLAVPRWLADAAITRAMAALHADADARAVTEMIRGVRLSPGRVRVTYRWSKDTVERLRARLIPELDQQRIRAYNDRLVRVTRDLPRGAGLDRLLVPLLTLADERSTVGDPAAENRFALLVLEAYVNGRDLGLVVPGAREWARPRRLAPTIQGRRDFSQHFMTSALVAAIGGTALADALGIYKEILDARAGSGFSFTDLAADRAGTRFGELCVRSRSGALKVQRAARGGLRNADLMPASRDLPENMGQAEFRRRFGGTEDARFRQVSREIERRLDGLPLYR